MPRVRFIKNTVIDRVDYYEGDTVELDDEHATAAVETFKKAVYVDGDPGAESKGPVATNLDPTPKNTR